MSGLLRYTKKHLAVTAFFIASLPVVSEAVPGFARQYNISCATCHAAFPRLNEFGEQFVSDNYRLPNWKDSTVKTGDDMLALPDKVPFAVRMQAYMQTRDAGVLDVSSGAMTTANSDFQAPFQLKLLSGAPLSEHISYYFYAIFAEKGDNGSVILEDAWISHDDLFDSGIGMMIGQFQVSDLMFPREIRLTFQDFMVYRMAGLTYDRGIVFSTDAGGLDVALGFVNGNGIEQNLTINSPGYKRPDHLFDNDNNKAAFGRMGFELAGVNIGLFGYAGSQKNAVTDSNNPAGTGKGNRDTDKIAYGIDLSGKLGDKTYWFAQVIHNQWDDFINLNTPYRWFGSFIGVDYIHSDHWAYSMLLNYTDANDLKNTDTVYEGIDMRTLTLTASYYFMRNVKAVMEINFDLLDEVAQSGSYWTGHLTSENYALIGFDAAF